jgi:hypothetical protein
MNPIDSNGGLVLPGFRLCNHRDCVNPAHVAPPH